MKSPLEGIRVIDATAFGAAPIAGAFLADWGAEVIHIEHPIRGDGTRGVQYGTGVGIFQQARVNYAMEFYNHSKKSVTLDLAQEKGREVMYRLVKTADVFVSILRPYELEKYGLEYGQLSQLNPKLIYAHLGGYGRKGPDRDRPGYDSCAFFARSGITHQLSTYCKSPIINRPALGDNMTGLALFAGVVLALLVRERLGIGQEVDVSLFNTGILSLALDIQGAILTGENVTTEPRETTSNPLRNFYQTKDKRWILLAMMQPDPYWPRFCKAIEREELERDPRFDSFEHRRKNCADLIIILDEAFATRTLAEWKERLSKFNLIFEPVQSPTEVANDPQAIANEYFSDFAHPTYGPIKIVGAPIKLSETPATIRSAAPEFSQNTEEVLLELGYSWEDILSLKDQKVIS
jgi:crotonobetainyl-CoA:carnitine CoA-transferase CaiB-like acyl-CoA transferase